jgi:hypothetical protein
MQVVPVQALPNQTFQVQLGGQACIISLYQLQYGLFMDATVPNGYVTAGTICENLNRIVRAPYLGFVGDLIFLDTQGVEDPVYTGLGSRWVLLYLDPADIPAE